MASETPDPFDSTHKTKIGDEQDGLHIDLDNFDSNSDDDDDEDYIEDTENVVEDVEQDMDDFRDSVCVEDDDLEVENDGIDELHVELDDFESNSENEDDVPPLKRTLKQIRKKNKGKELTTSPFYVGQLINDKKEIALIVGEHALESRRQLHIKRNEKNKFQVVCMGITPMFKSGECSTFSQNVSKKVSKRQSSQKTDASGEESCSASKKPRKKYPKPTCPWNLYISRNDVSESWCVKTFRQHHECMQTRVVNLYTMSWIAREIAPLVEDNPTIPLVALQNQLQKKHQVQISLMKISRARSIALKKLDGDYHIQYGLLRDYCSELIRANPGTMIKIAFEPPTNPSSLTRQFRRVYICFAALKKGFKMIRREILGLDGCFMKGPFPGQILTAVGVDANNGIYPVAYALVEAETSSSWTWFLECLGDDLDLNFRSNFTFISDRQKGLVPAIAKTFPSAEHRYRLRHIHENMKAKWRGDVFKNMLWNCASATTVQKFEKRMEEIKKDDASLHAWLNQIPQKHWTRSHFSGRAKCDVLLNNLCEVFNKQLIRGRDKPIITCLEYIREYMMRRIMLVHKAIAKCEEKNEGPLTPYAKKMFDAIKIEAAKYKVAMASPHKYEVSMTGTDQHVVNIDAKTCSCRTWELTAMPCKHAVAVLWNIEEHNYDIGILERWVSEVYWLDIWKKVYMNTLEPINGKDLWIPVSCPTKLIAPKHHTQIGRPKKMRKKSAIEIEEAVTSTGKLTRKGTTKLVVSAGTRVIIVEVARVKLNHKMHCKLHQKHCYIL